MRKTIPIAVAGALLGPALASAAAQPSMVVADLADLSLEQLANITVTSASRREERLVEAPASIFVITAEDIRRSGANSLYEALRLAPNLQVVRGDTSQWIATARGGLAGTANKMLMLIDGRTVYSPLFSGVFSDAQSVFLEDVDRIEVISGPGSTLWGTNAVNGVINVTTKPATRTRGVLAMAGAGDDDRGAGLRYGASSTPGSSYRLFARYFDRRDQRLQSGASARDDADRWLAGFRVDSAGSVATSAIDGQVYGANVNNLGGERPLSGGHLRGRWEAAPGEGSRVVAQAYYDRTEREHRGSFAEQRDTFDVEASHALRLGDRHDWVWGGGYRVLRDNTTTTPALGFMPEARTLNLGTLYAQDTWQATPRLAATLGLRAERNSYTGLEWLPNARLSYAFSPEHSAWSALTRTVRSPSRIDRELVIPGAPPYVLVPGGMQSEIANVVEIGYRGRIAAGASISLTAFHHRFDKLRTVEAAGTGLAFANGAQARLSGLEGWGDLTLSRDWRIVWGFTAMDVDYRIKPGRIDLGGSMYGNDPKRTAQVRSLWNVAPRVELDVAARYMGELPNPRVPSYTTVDARIGWRVSPDLELSLLVANLFDREHIEFATPAVAAVFGRSAFLKVTWSL